MAIHLTAEKFTKAGTKHFSPISCARIRRFTSAFQLNFPSFISAVNHFTNVAALFTQRQTVHS